MYSPLKTMGSFQAFSYYFSSPDDFISHLYDTFTGKYGLINNRGNYLAFASDESYFLLCSLEVLDDDGKFKRKADMFTKRTIKPHRTATSVETASEALALSIGEKACVDLGYMEQLTGKTQEELIADLQGVIFRVPNAEPARYVTADEYLSGNVREKLTVAEIAAKQDPSLSVNVEALKQVIPKDLPASEIAVRLGTTWIPQEDIQQFVMELLTPSQHARGRIKVRYTPYNGDWFIENKTSDYGNVKADSTYGTKRASAYRIIEDTLNLKDTRIFDYVYDEHGNKKAVFNHKETTAAQAKQEVIKQAFQDWIWKDPERRNRLVRYYNDTFNSIRTREYDGSHITFGGISPEIQLRPHQVNAIAHILYGGNTLLAHKVGAGKTFEMVAAAQESKRLGLCNKSMFVVPNHLVGQWASEYLRLYPSANILVTTKQDFETANRKKFCSRIATGDYDAVIIGHSQFEKIQMSVERQYEQLQKQLDDIERACFVSWCAEQCGYLESGIIPKYSLCSDGVNWFRNNGQWQGRDYEPTAGNLIFFDWEGDGTIDHTGIVEKSENGTVYTVEGNSGDECKQRNYPVGSSVIYGYGIPAY